MAWDSVVLRHGDVTLRPLTMADRKDWEAVRAANASWLVRWEATRPPSSTTSPVTFRGMVRDLRRQAREGRCLPFVIDIEGRFAGQVTVNNIVGGSAMFASIGYWIDQRYAGRGYVPLSVALATDHCFTRLGLHRVEIAIRPENTASLRVVEKLGFGEFGYAPRFLHIDGEWRDHRLFALTAEEVPEGLVQRFLRAQSPRSSDSHE